MAVVRLLRAGFMLALFAALFAATDWTQPIIRLIHITVLRLLGCQVPPTPLLSSASCNACQPPYLAHAGDVESVSNASASLECGWN